MKSVCLKQVVKGGRYMGLLTILLKVIDLYSMALVIYALLSWFPGAYETTLGQILDDICSPFLKLFEKLPLTFFGLDFSVVVALFTLQVISRLLVRIFMTLLIY